MDTKPSDQQVNEATTTTTVTKARKQNWCTRQYLLFYNGLQLLGWFAVFLVMVWHYVENENCSGLWKKEEYLVKFFQSLMLVEVLHAIFGVVPSNPLITAMQISSRVFVVWAVIHSFARVHNSITIPLLMTAWSVTEVIRYAYYLLHLWSTVPHTLLWCRYTFFIVLYPLGVIGEVLTTIFALPYIRDSDRYSISLPNPTNFSFSFYYFVIIVLLLYIPGFPQMYLHMMRQRKKVLTPAPKKVD